MCLIFLSFKAEAKVLRELDEYFAAGSLKHTKGDSCEIEELKLETAIPQVFG
jgi:hypothetical protein